MNDRFGNMNDVVIIGAGSAGLSAALWCDELGLRTLVLEGETEVGGQLSWVYNAIENHLGGLSARNGVELRNRFVEQIKTRAFALQTNVRVTKLDLAKRRVITAEGKEFTARTIILATGIRRRKLNVAGEDEFRGRGILESGKRDARLHARDKAVAVVGGGDAAAENALIAVEFAREVYLIHRRREFRARPEFLEKIQQNKRIKVLTEVSVQKISGGEKVESIELKNQNSNETTRLNVEAVLIRIGVEPNNELFKSQIALDDCGYARVNAHCETDVENVFAIGDIANPLAPTVSGAVGMGATAAKVIAARFT